ncbi:MAG: hypothetical protein JW940_33975 [Polyangiaceae bacterium]|nr:hypothetical protein [Polyangiaceae bacterium]
MGILFMWFWGLGALTAALLSLVALGLCWFARTGRAAAVAGVTSLVASATVVPASLYMRQKMLARPPEQVVGLATAGGLARDHGINLVLASVAIALSVVAIAVARRMTRCS